MIITTEVVTIVISSFLGLRYEPLGPWPTIWGRPTEKKKQKRLKF